MFSFKKDVVIVFSKNFCGQCRMVKNFLAKHEIDFTEINVDKDENSKYIDVLKIEGIRQLPVTLINGKVILGFAPNLLEKEI